MRVLNRRPTNKRKSVKSFRHHAKHTKSPNLAPPPHRGGYRL